MEELNIKGQKAKKASYLLSRLSSSDKNKGLKAVADALLLNEKAIIEANKIDVQSAEKNGIKGSLVDRLTLDSNRIKSMAEGIEQIIQLDDPIGEVMWMKKRPNDLEIGKKIVPLGVIGIIYEARPNVTVDAFALCFKTGNAVILRGGKEAINSNLKIIEIIKNALVSADMPSDAVSLIEDTSRETATKMMRLNEYLDVLIPRGGAGLIQAVVNNSTVPVIETGVGNCHIFVDKEANLEMAKDILVNAKTQRPGVCNACESLVVHADVAKEFLPMACKALREYNVTIVGDTVAKTIVTDIEEASEEDYRTEYLDYKISVKVVNNIDEALNHINNNTTKHSESIITESYTNARRFLNEIDAAAVYVNASTRFTDGYEFGFGAEIGISTQKLHARGPMGLRELTTTKYVIYGNGQVRN
ncbi:glutamate-5-semialdehyde dehydrogenase [Vallitalea sp.]|jgi:glutamate-5-semialdehyde dehydrogenase|uniref:glutamate-5-semialdehyde dehydrogenase n=1 Tax=Vallitalea sp. TaxID=1882829 RepID=UPI0025DDBAAB|nr:glutamate-5-semialdehyde dehydrogenase [Vallitalea sp.]MCT4688374.1 glutamate-5-semialdehyde dehydrogenase [Vallitalea sp.]